MRLENVGVRSNLKPRPSPYWKKVSSGRAIGFRKTTSTSDGTWLGQFYDPGTQKQTRFSIGDLSHLPKHQQYDQALLEIEQRFALLDHGVSLDVVSVADACRTYVDHLNEIGRNKTAKETEARFRRWVYVDPIAKIALLKLNRANLSDWRTRLSKASLLSHGQPIEGTRSQATVNRDITSLRAALNHAYERNHIPSDAAWRSALKATANADSRRHDYLDSKDRKKLIEAADVDLGLFLKAMSVLPLRPGAIAELLVEDLDMKRSILHIRKDKAAANRNIALPNETAQFFHDQAIGKKSNDYLFTRSDGMPWNKDMWKMPIKEAVTRANLSESVTAYTLRHSGITDLVTAGLPLLTIAQITGTSVAMIERHYGHLTAEKSQDALRTLIAKKA